MVCHTCSRVFDWLSNGKEQTMNKWIKYDDVVALLKAHAQDGDNLTLIGDETAEALENIPGIDICFCRECKWEWTQTCPPHRMGLIHDENDYCSYGIRKGEANEMS